MHSVLLVEDDQKLARIVREFLEGHGFVVGIEHRGDHAVPRIVAEKPDAVILDINLPGMDGFSVCRAVREFYTGAIVMLTARSEDVDEVLGLDYGADDYLTKPVRPRVLLARLHSHLRRSSALEDDRNVEIRVGGLSIYPKRRSIELRGVPIEVTSAEFDVLFILAQRAGKTVSRIDLFEQLLGEKYDYRDRSIDLRISRLRRKLGDNPQNPSRIKSVRGEGYMLSSEP